MLLALLLLFPSDEALSLQAGLGSEELRAGATIELRITCALGRGWSAPPNPLLPGGEPAALLQLDLPAEIEPEGEAAASFSALLRQAFLDLPHERLLELGANTITLRVSDALAVDAALEFNVLIYAAPDTPGALGPDRDARPRLVRRRYRVALQPGAQAERVPDGAATWGQKNVLALGETVPAFELPTPFGEPLTSAKLLGEGLVVLTTYRSCL